MISETDHNSLESDLGKAIRLFDEEIERLGIESFGVPEIGPGIGVSHLSDESGIVGPLMMKTDIDCLILTDLHAWSVDYLYDPESLFGVVVEDQYDTNRGVLRNETLQRMLIRHAVSHLIDADHEYQVCRLNQLPGYYLYSFLNEPGSKIELAPMDVIFPASFSDHADRYWKRYGAELEKSIEPKMP